MVLILSGASPDDPRLPVLQGFGLPLQADSAPVQGDRLLLDPRARPDAAWCAALAELRETHPGALLLGRAWAEAEHPPRLDPPDRPGWLLLPEPLRPEAVPPGGDLPADPAAALAVLLPLADRHAWPLREATAVAPLRRSGAAACGGGWPRHPRGARRLGRGLPQAPALELLLLAPAATLPALQEALQPAACLPWRVLAEPLESAADPIPPLRELLNRSAAELLWPLLPVACLQPPSPALVAAVLRRLQRVDLDGLELGSHGLVLRRSWWLDSPAADPPEQLARRVRRRGAHLASLGLEASCTPAAMADPDPLRPALLAALDRAEALLLAQHQRIRLLEQEQRRLRAQLSPPPLPPPPPADPEAG